MDQLNIWTAFAAGVISFLSPCILPLIPGYISFISGISLENLSHSNEKRANLKKSGLCSISFVLGFSILFTLLGASASGVGRFLIEYISILSKIAGVVIIFFGLHTIGILPIKWLYYEKKIQMSQYPSGLIGSFVMGVAFAFGWTPCIGPILAGILALAATQEKITQGMFLLSIYSLGLGIPLIITGFSMNTFLQFFNRYKRWIRWSKIFAGILLVFIGGLIFTNNLKLLISFLPAFFLKFSL